MAEAIRDGLRLEAIAADIAGDGDAALGLLSVNAYDIAVLDRDIPGPSGDEIARRIVDSGSGMPILMLTAADRLDDKASGSGSGPTTTSRSRSSSGVVLRLRALDRRRAHHRPPVREIAGVRLDLFRREVFRDGRYVALTRKQFAVLEVLVAAEGGVVSAEELLERAWDENEDPFTNAVRITVSALRSGSANPGSSPPWPAPGTASTPHADIETVDRAPGLSVRLKLTLSYAGFLMLAGALLLAVVWVFLLRYVPDRVVLAVPGPSFPDRSDLLAASLRRWRSCWGSCSCSASWEGGCSPARCSLPGSHHRGHAPGRDRIAVTPDPAGGPQRRVPRARRRLRRHARAARGAGRRAAAVRRQRLPRAAHPAGDHADAARRGPQGPGAATTASSSSASTSSTPGRSTSPRPCSCSAAPTSGPSSANTPTFAHRRGGDRDAPPPRGETRRHHRDLRRPDPDHRLTRAAAADDDEPRAQRDRPQPARPGHRAGHDQRHPQDRGAHGREHGREAHPAAGLHARRAVPARLQAHPHRPRGRRAGLAIVKSITEAHEGTLTLAPRPGGGLHVTVELPAA